MSEPTREELLKALLMYEAAFADLFGQCCSNPIKNAWGKEISLTNLNDAHENAERLIRREYPHELEFTVRVPVKDPTGYPEWGEGRVTPRPAPHKKSPTTVGKGST